MGNTGNDKKTFARMRDAFAENKTYNIVFTVMLVMQILIVTYNFVFEKQDYHSDEMWSYGLSNSFFRETLEEPDLSDFNTWLDGSLFRNYITVQKGQQFRYDSIWSNLKGNLHTPFYHIIIHTICSLFPDTFSMYYAFAVNFAAMIIGQIYLYRAASRICKSRFAGLAVCALWGFSTGFINMNVFLRPYALVTMFTAMLVFYQSRVYFSEGNLRDNLIKIGVVTFLGGFTHHYFLVPAFALAAFFCIFYLCKREYRKMFLYAAAMAGGAVLSIAAFPYALQHIFDRLNESNSWGESGQNLMMPLPHGIKICMLLIMQSLTGIYTTPYLSSAYGYVLAAVVVLAVVAIPLSFLFRNEVWFKELVRKVRAGAGEFARKIDFMYIALALSVLFLATAVAMSVNINMMEKFTDRYLFNGMPIAAILIVLTVKYIAAVLKPLKKYSSVLISLCCCAAIASSGINCEKRYLFKYKFNGAEGFPTARIAETCNENSSYIIMMDASWHPVCFCAKLIDCKQVFFTMSNMQLETIEDRLKQFDPGSGDCYLILETDVLTVSEKIKSNANSDTSADTDTADPDARNKVTFEYTDEYYEEKYKDIASEEEILDFYASSVFPGYRMQFYGSEPIMGNRTHLFKLVPESEYMDAPLPK